MIYFNTVTGFREFDDQTNCIGRGNILANTMYSSYIRPYGETQNGSYTGKPGEFLKFDLRNFTSIPPQIAGKLIDQNRTESFILYKFFIHRNDKRDVIGHILTDANYSKILDVVHCGHSQNYEKRLAIMNEVSNYVCN